MAARKRIAIITGATSGFGKIFTELADQQFKNIDEFWIVGRDASKLIDLSNKISHRTRLIPYDLTKMYSLKKIAGFIKEEKPK